MHKIVPIEGTIVKFSDTDSFGGSNRTSNPSGIFQKYDPKRGKKIMNKRTHEPITRVIESPCFCPLTICIKLRTTKPPNKMENAVGNFMDGPPGIGVVKNDNPATQPNMTRAPPKIKIRDAGRTDEEKSIPSERKQS